MRTSSIWCAVWLLAACGRIGFDNSDAGGVIAANRSTIDASAPTVMRCNRVMVTLTTRAANDEIVTGGGAVVEFALTGGTAAGEFEPVVDHADGRYSTLFTGTVAGEPGTVTATVNGGVVATAPPELRVEDEVTPAAGRLFLLDAAHADAGCVRPAGDHWSDNVNGLMGDLVGFVDTRCPDGDSGWCGAGVADDPFRLALDGVDDYVDFGPEVATPTYTLAAWVRPRGAGVITTTGTGGIDLEPIVSKGAADVEEVDKDTNYVMGITTGRTVGTDFERDPDSLNLPLVGNATIADGTWHHLVVTYDRTERRIYVDGVLDRQQPLAFTPSIASLSRLCIGTARRFDLTLPPRGSLQGDVAIVVIYDRALDATEVVDLCQAQAQRFAGSTCS